MIAAFVLPEKAAGSKLCRPVEPNTSESVAARPGSGRGATARVRRTIFSPAGHDVLT